MKEQADESRYVRLNRLRLVIEEKALLRDDETIAETVRDKTERLRQLRLAKEALDRAARKQRSSQDRQTKISTRD